MNSSSPLVSIIIPTYNRTHLIGETLESVLAQTYTNWECIIVDDGSTDDTEDKVKKYIDDERFVILKRDANKKKGASSCRNIGLDNAKGKFIQFLDSDDLMDKNKLSEQLNRLKNEKTPVLATCKWGKLKANNEKQIYKNLEVYKDFDDSLKFLNSLGRSRGFLPLHAYLISKEIITFSGNWNENLSNNDDAEFMVRVILNSDKILFCNNTSVCYRSTTEGSLSDFDNKEKALSSIKSWKLITSYIKDNHQNYNITFIDDSLKRVFERVKVYFPELIEENKQFFFKQIKADKVKNSFINKARRKITSFFK